MRRIKVLGITGGVGAGKSTVLSYLEKRYGAKVIELDRVAHTLMDPDGACFSKIVETFGPDILTDGLIDHGKLYRKAFSAGRNPKILNAIVHPAVKEEVKRLLIKEQTDGNAPFTVLEAALLLEDHYDQICDEIWYLFVREPVREKRLMASRGYSRQKIREILANQKTDEEFRKNCQFVIDNSSDLIENTYEQIDRGLKEHEFV